MAKGKTPIKPEIIELEGNTYEIIQGRLKSHAGVLQDRMNQLNTTRKKVFGAIDTQLIANDRITTTHNCEPSDMVAIGNHFIFGYNVHVGLRKGLDLSDVFSVYRFEPSDHSFHEESLELIQNERFEEDFRNLYKYYKDTVFAKFAVIGPHLFMVFRVGKGTNDIKTFKWALFPDRLEYLGNRFDHEYRYPNQHDFVWKRVTRDMHRGGLHPHVSIEERVFVETVGGDLTIKVEDNTDSGHGVYAEPVDNPDQTLDDAEYYYADLGNLIVLKIRPYQEKAWRYFIFNAKMEEALRVDAIETSCILLPDDQGVVFSNGYYLQTGAYKLFDNIIHGLHFEKRIASSNGEDYLFVFYHQGTGLYVLLPYNLVEQKINTPIFCQGFSIFPDGELCYFRAEDEPGRHHVVQVWQTPYGVSGKEISDQPTTYLSKVGNKDLVRGMAECNELLTLLEKEDTYGNLYVDLIKKSADILDSYYWINHQETFNLNDPVKAIGEAAAAAIDEYEKVRRIRQHTAEALKLGKEKYQQLLDKIKRYKPREIDAYVSYLADLRILRGEIIGLKELRYVDLGLVEEMETAIAEKTDQLSQECVTFLLTDEALVPYEKKIEDVKAKLEAITKVAEADAAGEEMDAIGKELELLIEIVNNLKIDDATQTTRIVEQISTIYARLNSLRATLRKARKDLLGTEAAAEFQAQVKLLQQGMINFIDLCETPEKCDEYLTKLMVQVEELEGKFADFDAFVLQLSEQRETIYEAFETRKLNLIETRNRRANALMEAADRMLKGIKNRASGFEEVNEINAYFAGDLMVEKVRDIIGQLNDLQDSVKAGDIQSRLKTVREDTIRQLKDRSDLFVKGENIIQLGRHHFSVNVQPLDLTMVLRDSEMNYHLTGTNFFEKVIDATFLESRSVWDQTLISENKGVYRGEYLANKLLTHLKSDDAVSLTVFHEYSEEEKMEFVRRFMSTRFQEGYVKGIHDQDAVEILKALVDLEEHIDLLRFTPEARACASLYWTGFINEADRQLLHTRLKGAGVVLELFPDTREFQDLVSDIQESLRVFIGMHGLFPEKIAEEAGQYIFTELSRRDAFVISGEAADLYKDFQAFLKKKKFNNQFDQSIRQLAESPEQQFELIRNWVRAFYSNHSKNGSQTLTPKRTGYADEVASIIFGDRFDPKWVINVPMHREMSGMMGEHALVTDGTYLLNYHDFTNRLQTFDRETVPLFRAYSHAKIQLLDTFKQELRLEEFRPRVLTSFVRNQLIDKVYLPMIGDNLAKQMGTAGENTRTDRMGMLLLISPPGYGKTTLMEYLANRLGLIFMKINGPAIGHQVTSLDSAEAPNAAAREELEKLNLALEMGDNIMLYVDDIQHCSPEFLQKFISLCDAQRKIEGVYKGRTRTYDLRGKKVVVVMAGNPYTESGEKFRIPDMLANRADTYNLGDILGGSEDLFKLSYIENALTSNPVLARLASHPQKDIYQVIRLAETGNREGIEFESSISEEELKEYVSILRHLFEIRDVVLTVNQQYIQSAAKADLFRTEPPFLLQGSYRNINKLAEKLVAVMNKEELEMLIHSHYQQEVQTLTSGAEANFLKFKMITGRSSEEERKRWEEICRLYVEDKSLNGDRMAQLVAEMSSFSAGLMQIKNVLEKGVSRDT